MVDGKLRGLVHRMMEVASFLRCYDEVKDIMPRRVVLDGRLESDNDQ
jgi:hypothetical protein